MEDGVGGGLGDRLLHESGGLDDEVLQHASGDAGAIPGATGDSDDQGCGGLVVVCERPDGDHCLLQVRLAL